MLIEIHFIQNHCPANLNRDDLDAPKTCYFGGVLRSRISSQCIKRSIRTSDDFKSLCGGIRTRRLVDLIAEKVTGKDVTKRAENIFKACGIKLKKKKPVKKGTQQEDDESENEDKSKMLVYTTYEAVKEMARLLQNSEKTEAALTDDFKKLISDKTAVPDMALCGRMLETGEIENTAVEAALQTAHAISTHEARQEVDYFVAADDVPGDDAGAGHLGEAMFASACFYKYFSINWEQLTKNLKGYGKDFEKLAAHTVGAFLNAAAYNNPSGKQNSFAAHNFPSGVLVEIRNRNTAISYANAFADPVVKGERDVIKQSIAQLAQYIHDIDTGYGKPDKRFWFSPSLRHPLCYVDNNINEIPVCEGIESFDKLRNAVLTAIGYDWEDVKKVVVKDVKDFVEVA
ncbi:MAG: type I-E CRISPR-associated protein Cas7/Cse4/CasC [Candidatus Magnetominusculus sp. LBB02]|nr:type I-E CRISPR-associated protein Cas7/Cse4/CasC [Candidatus Magnetominusculus sp. LBB02]